VIADQKPQTRKPDWTTDNESETSSSESYWTPSIRCLEKDQMIHHEQKGLFIAENEIDEKEARDYYAHTGS
jgi:hypothetical protein